MSQPSRIEIPLEARTAVGDALTDLVLATFELNGLFLEAAEDIARPAGLTPARWQVLGAILMAPASVSAIARTMGLTRQGVQRTADLLVEAGFACFKPNPHHRRAQLLDPTSAGRDAIARLSESQHTWANRMSARIGQRELREAV